MTRAVCCHGRPLLVRSSDPICAQCEADLARDIAAFERDVFFGVYDAEGYTPAERKAQQKRREVPR